MTDPTSTISRFRFLGVELRMWIAAFAVFAVVAHGGQTAIEAGLIARIHLATTLGFLGGVLVMWLGIHQEVDDDE